MTDEKDRQAIALFRYGLIAEVVQLPSGSRGLYARLREKAALEHRIPGSYRTRVAVETMRHWIKDYRNGGFDALLPRPRADRGCSRALPQPVADALLELKEGSPELSIPQLIAELERRGLAGQAPQPAPSTVHRLLARAGLMDKTAGEPVVAERRRFAFEHPRQLWMSDVMHGPSVTLSASRVRRKTYLIAFLDDATRVVPYCAFALAENTQAFLPVFKQALRKRSANPSFGSVLKLRSLRLGHRRGGRGEHGSTADAALPGAGGGVSGLWPEGQGMGRGQRRAAGHAGQLVRARAALAAQARGR